MPIMQVFQDGKFPVKVYTNELDDLAERQLRNLSHLPILYSHAAAMPDAHGGKGSTVGSVIPTMKAIIPAAVGVDIGCGMNALKLDLRAEDLPDSLVGLREEIERRVPLGPGRGHDHPRAGLKMMQEFGKRFDKIVEKHPQLAPKQADKWVKQWGSLGGGNHFIEVCLDEEGYVWLMLHSGSRGIGNAIGTYFISKAKEAMGKYIHLLPDPDLAYLVEDEGETLFTDYIEAMLWAQDYALQNRQMMMQMVLSAVTAAIDKPYTISNEAVNCHHNYAELENHFGANMWVTRKGAVRARKGDMGIIPGSMGACSYIVRGKGNPESFMSCSHGAGRIMSRGDARRRFTVEDLVNSTEGIECRKDKGVIDESPGAYKDIDLIMAQQSDLVEVVHRLKQVVNVKG